MTNAQLERLEQLIKLSSQLVQHLKESLQDIEAQYEDCNCDFDLDYGTTYCTMCRAQNALLVAEKIEKKIAKI